jgi:hypothetical protein
MLLFASVKFKTALCGYLEKIFSFIFVSLWIKRGLLGFLLNNY